MTYKLKQSLVLLGALLVLLTYFFEFSSSSFLPSGISLQYLNGFFTQVTLPLFTGQIPLTTRFITLLDVALLCLGYWGVLLLALVHIGLSIRMLRSPSHRVRTWSIILAICGLVLIALFFVGAHLWITDFRLNFHFGGYPPPASTWDILHHALDPVILWQDIVTASRILWLPALSFLLILAMSILTRLQERLHTLVQDS